MENTIRRYYINYYNNNATLYFDGRGNFYENINKVFLFKSFESAETTFNRLLNTNRYSELRIDSVDINFDNN